MPLSKTSLESTASVSFLTRELVISEGDLAVIIKPLQVGDVWAQQNTYKDFCNKRNAQ